LLMPCCCIQIYDFCKVNSCDEEGIVLAGLFAEQEGVYKLELVFLDTSYLISKEFFAGDELKFSTVFLNDYHQYKAQLFAPDGSLVSYQDSDCISFTTHPVYELAV
jgi:hypothetical protein